MLSESVAQSILLGGTVLALVIAAVLRLDSGFNNKVAEAGLPMFVLLLSSGVYKIGTSGVTGVLADYSTSVFVGVVSAGLTAFIMDGGKASDVLG